MNKERRNTLRDVVLKLEDIKSTIEQCADDELETFNNLSEGLQATAKAIAMEEAGTTLMDLAGTLEDVIDSINGVIE